jgi:putative membrane protein
MFYIVRLFIYNREAQDKEPAAKLLLQEQFSIMIRRLWFGITWPSAVLTLIFGTWIAILYNALPSWLLVKLAFVVCLFAYHISLHVIYKRQMAGDFRTSSQKLRIWNELATIFLIAIVMLVVVKQEMSLAWGLGGLLLVILLLMSAIKIYKNIRNRNIK